MRMAFTRKQTLVNDFDWEKGVWFKQLHHL